MSNPDIGFVAIRNGIVESATDAVPVFVLDVLDDDFTGDDMILDVRYLRAELSGYLDGLDEYRDADREYLSALVVECDEWLTRHDGTTPSR